MTELPPTRRPKPGGFWLKGVEIPLNEIPEDELKTLERDRLDVWRGVRSVEPEDLEAAEGSDSGQFTYTEQPRG